MSDPTAPEPEDLGLACVLRGVQRLLRCVLLAPLAACATGAHADAMLPESLPTPACAGAEILAHAVTLGSVGGGSETSGWDRSMVSDASLAEALRASLERNGMLSPGAEQARFRLDVFLIELSQPESGFTTEVVSFLRYKLIETASQVVVYDELITSSAVLDHHAEFFAVTRMRLVNEGSMRGNIGSFFEDLCARAASGELTGT